jgi:hypothetical protein
MPLKKMEEEPSYRLGVAISILEGILGMKEDPSLRGISKKIWMDSGKKFVLKERRMFVQIKKEES